MLWLNAVMAAAAATIRLLCMSWFVPGVLTLGQIKEHTSDCLHTKQTTLQSPDYTPDARMSSIQKTTLK